MFSEFHFLVVDDVPLMRQIAGHFLNALGYIKISEAEDGEQALKLLRPNNATETPINFIITDWNMPVMDGISLLRAIRTCPKLKHLPVLMVSSQAEEDGLVIARWAGIDGYISKPLNARALKAALDDILTRKGLMTGPNLSKSEINGQIVET